MIYVGLTPEEIKARAIPQADADITDEPKKKSKGKKSASSTAGEYPVPDFVSEADGNGGGVND